MADKATHASQTFHSLHVFRCTHVELLKKNVLYHLYHSVIYVTFTKAKKHRDLSYKEISLLILPFLLI